MTKKLRRFHYKILFFKYFKFISNFSSWLYNIARGIDIEPVTTRLVSKSIGCCKKFPGKSALLTEEDVKHWLFELSQELTERLEQDLTENNRKARQIVVSFAQQIGKKDVSSSRTTILNAYEARKIFEDTFEVIKKFCLKSDGGFCLKFLGLSAGHFEDMKNVREITSFFKASEKQDFTIGKVDRIKNLNNFFSSMENLEDCIPISEPGPSTSHTTQIAVEDEDSISSELFSSNEQEINEQIETSSFFVNYLNAMQNNSPVERNFNTSKILEEDTLSTSSSETTEEPTVEKIITDDEKNKITCEQCGKKILATELTSHTDYHYALNIVRSEADLYKQKISDIKNRNPKKRKQSQDKPLATVLTKFLQKQNSCEDDDGEICSDCNKKIRLEDIESHRDYHVAKKLHVEINTSKINININKNFKDLNVKGKKKKTTRTKGNVKITPVTSFFKPI